jgi:hypothetical protein
MPPARLFDGEGLDRIGIDERGYLNGVVGTSVSCRFNAKQSVNLPRVDGLLLVKESFLTA